MKLQQLRYICEVVKNDLNVSATAQSLYTSQPGISKQIRALEDELGLEIFTRSGKHLTCVTQPGSKILTVAEEILQQVNKIKQIAEEFTGDHHKELRLGCPSVVSNLVLGEVWRSFMADNEEVKLSIHEDENPFLLELLLSEQIDLAFLSEPPEDKERFNTIPCCRLQYAFVVSQNHELADAKSLSSERLAQSDLAIQSIGQSSERLMESLRRKNEQDPRVLMESPDANLIKDVVRNKNCIGVLASAALNNVEDDDLTSFNASHWLKPIEVHLATRRHMHLKSYMLDFIQRISPQIDDDILELSGGELEKLHTSFAKIPTF